MNRSIIHLNVADFAVAVERAVDQRLNQRPVIIAPEGAARAAVYDMSNEAYMAGIRKGMALRRAVRLCRDVQILPPHPDRYELAMRDVLKRALPYSPLIETGEDDGHLFMDATGTSRLFGPPMDVAWRLRRQIKTDLGLDPVWSVAPNKLVAKVATRLVKPDGEYIVAPGAEKALLAPLPVSLLPGIEHSDQRSRLQPVRCCFTKRYAASIHRRFCGSGKNRQRSSRTTNSVMTPTTPAAWKRFSTAWWSRSAAGCAGAGVPRAASL
jgi:DNA polymerase-4